MYSAARRSPSFVAARTPMSEVSTRRCSMARAASGAAFANIGPEAVGSGVVPAAPAVAVGAIASGGAVGATAPPSRPQARSMSADASKQTSHRDQRMQFKPIEGAKGPGVRADARLTAGKAAPPAAHPLRQRRLQVRYRASAAVLRLAWAGWDTAGA